VAGGLLVNGRPFVEFMGAENWGGGRMFAIGSARFILCALSNSIKAVCSSGETVLFCEEGNLRRGRMMFAGGGGTTAGGIMVGGGI
jgi:hypothetical protein